MSEKEFIEGFISKEDQIIKLKAENKVMRKALEEVTEWESEFETDETVIEIARKARRDIGED